MRSLLIASLFGLLAGTLPAWACYSGLIIIPTAETVGAGQYSLDLQMDGPILDTRADTYLLNTEFGLGQRLEVGVDYDFSPGAATHLLFNTKYVLPVSAKTALAIGTTNMGNHLRPNPYVVTTTEFSAYRGHLGAMRIDGKTRWFGGVDHELKDGLTLMADYTSGSENFAALGADYAVGKHMDVFAGVQFPNDHSATRFTVHLIFCGPYQRGAAKD